MTEIIVPTAGVSPSAEESSPAEKLEKPLNLPRHVTRFRATIRHPKSKTRVSLGTFDTLEEAEVAVEKMQEEIGYTERKPPRNLPRYVEKKNSRFRARLRHPVLKTRVSLGSFDTPEEAEVAVHKFREQFGCPQRNVLRKVPRTLPSCVEKKNGRFRARIRHPVLKTRVSLGTFGTPEEAEVAVHKFREQFGRDTKLRDIHSEIVEEMCTTESIDRFGAEEELHVGVRPCSGSGLSWSSGVECNSTNLPRRLPSCVEKKNSRFRARIRHPVLKTRVSLGSFDTPEEAEVAVFKFREQLVRDTKLRDNPSEIIEEKCTTESTDRFGGEEELHVGMRPSSGLGSGVECNSTNLEECLRLGIINEYGQLLGEHSNLDDTLWFDTQSKNE